MDFYVIMQQCEVISQVRSFSIILMVTFNFMLRSQAKSQTCAICISTNATEILAAVMLEMTL